MNTSNEKMQIPPQNTEAEMAVLGSMLIEEGAISRAAEHLTAGDFYQESHKTIFSAITQLHDASKAVDLITLVEKLKSDGVLEAIGGAAYLAGLANAVPSAANVEQYAQIVKEKNILRLVIAQAAQITTDAYETEEDVAGVLSRAEQGISEITERCASGPGAGMIPETLAAFVQRDIPPVEFWVDGIVQKKGKTIISASTNIGKSIFIQNLALAMTTGATSFLKKFEVKPGRVLLLDLEMGESAVKDRLVAMCKKDGLTTENLFIKALPSFDIEVDQNFATLKKWILELKIDVVIIDHLSNVWSGAENDSEEVGRLTKRFNTLIDETGASVVLIHHHRKSSKDHEKAAVGERAAGSYRFTGWVDVHVCLQGQPSSVTISCEKSRNQKRFESFIAQINPETLSFEYLTDFEPQFGDETLEKLYNAIGNPAEAKVRDLCDKAEELKKAGENGMCSKTTVRKLLEKSALFEIDEAAGPKGADLVRRKPGVEFQSEIFDNGEE